MSRDEELDDLETELRTPYIEKPDDLDEGMGQTCFSNQDRMCGADCTAYNIHADPAQGPERCIIIVYQANTAIYTQELVQLGRKMLGRASVQAADAARAELAGLPIPDPGATR